MIYSKLNYHEKDLFYCSLFRITFSSVSKAQTTDTKMKTFIDALMKKMTLEEKLGQLNLPGAGDIVTGQAQNSDIGKKYGMDRLEGFSILKALTRSAMYRNWQWNKLVLRSPDLWDGCDTWLSNSFPHSTGAFLHLEHGSH